MRREGFSRVLSLSSNPSSDLSHGIHSALPSTIFFFFSHCLSIDHLHTWPEKFFSLFHCLRESMNDILFFFVWYANIPLEFFDDNCLDWIRNNYGWDDRLASRFQVSFASMLFFKSSNTSINPSNRKSNYFIMNFIFFLLISSCVNKLFLTEICSLFLVK